MNRNTVETIKQKLSIEAVVGSYIKLEKSGKNFRACCPFHQEKTPSFYVTPDKGIFYCFGCHKGGDIFSFVQAIESIEFIDALKSLAEKAGVTLDDYDQEKPSHLSLLREIMEHATKFYEVGLRTHAPVVEYLLGRGLQKETMVTFRVGYAPTGWSGLYDYLKRKKYSDEDILATGLCIQSKKEGSTRMYDRFRERIIFPISDSQGRIVAFTGRVMPGTEESNRPVGKYINSPETELYHKSHILFGLDKAKQSIHTEGFAILVEGQMDCIMSHQAGVSNTVALSGTACTDEHMTQLKRFTTDIALCLDTDTAGLAAAQKSAMVAYRHDFTVSAIDIPTGKDPADLIAQQEDLWKEIIKKRTDFISFRLATLKKNGGDKIKIAHQELFPILKEMASQIRIDDKLQEIAHVFEQSSVDPVRNDFQKYLQTNTVSENFIKKEETKKQGEIAHNNIKDDIIGILLKLRNTSFFQEQSKEYERVFGTVLTTDLEAIPIDIQSQLVFKIEHTMNEYDDERCNKILHDLLIRAEIVIIETKKQTLDRELAHDPSNTVLLQELHTILKNRDSLTRQLHH